MSDQLNQCPMCGGRLLSQFEGRLQFDCGSVVNRFDGRKYVQTPHCINLEMNRLRERLDQLQRFVDNLEDCGDARECGYRCDEPKVMYLGGKKP